MIYDYNLIFFIFCRLCEIEKKQSSVPKCSILAPSLIIKNVNLSYKEAIEAFGGLVLDEEKSKISKMLKKYPQKDAKALLLQGYCNF